MCLRLETFLCGCAELHVGVKAVALYNIATYLYAVVMYLSLASAASATVHLALAVALYYAAQKRHVAILRVWLVATAALLAVSVVCEAVILYYLCVRPDAYDYAQLEGFQAFAEEFAHFIIGELKDDTIPLIFFLVVVVSYALSVYCLIVVYSFYRLVLDDMVAEAFNHLNHLVTDNAVRVEIPEMQQEKY